MGEPSQKSADREACLITAEQVQRKLMALRRKINRLQDSSVGPNNPLPVDVFLRGMSATKNAPRIVFTPRRLGDHLWTESILAYVYAGIERAFFAAGRMPGGNRAGHVNELNKLRTWVERQEKRPTLRMPKFFTQKTALLFSMGILEERRRDRIEVISNIEHFSPTRTADLAQLKTWIDEDLEDCRLKKKGRPDDYQKIAFAAEIVNLWNILTERPISRGPETNFAQFVVACWKSGFLEVEVNSNFKRTIRDHIGEVEEPRACGRCDGCKKSERCERKRYAGIFL